MKHTAGLESRNKMDREGLSISPSKSTIPPFTKRDYDLKNFGVKRYNCQDQN